MSSTFACCQLCNTSDDNVSTRESILFCMSSLDIVLNLVLSWFNRSSTTWVRSEGCVSGAGYKKGG